MPYVVREVVCLGIPVVDGTVVQATHASRQVLAGVRELHPGEPLRVVVNAAVAGDAALAADDLEHSCRLEARRHFLQNRLYPAEEAPHRSRNRGTAALNVLLGLALLVASAGHWIPALAGAWLVAVRGLLFATPPSFRRRIPAPGPSTVRVRRLNHAGLAQLREVISRNLDERSAYSEAYEASARLGIAEASELYTALLKNPDPASLMPDAGFWLPDASRRREALTAGRPDEEPGAEIAGEEIEVVDVEVVEDADFVEEASGEPESEGEAE